MTAIKVVQWGCGKMGQILLRYYYEKGYEIVGVLDHNPKRIGKDAGLVSELKKEINVRIRHPEEAAKLFQETKADVCVIAVRSYIREIYEEIKTAIDAGVDVLTIAEEAFYPWQTSPDQVRQLDNLAKKTGSSILGSGFQDVFWANLIRVMIGSMQRIDRIIGYSQYNLDDYGKSFLIDHGVGLTAEDFIKEMTKPSDPPFILNAAQWLCAALKLNCRELSQKIQSITSSKSVYTPTLEQNITPGHCLGKDTIVIMECQEGPIIEIHSIGKVYGEEDTDYNEWTFDGEPLTSVTNFNLKIPELTCATIANRIPELVKSPPGFITSDQLAPAEYVHPKLGCT